jgi:hypothetical protein
MRYARHRDTIKKGGVLGVKRGRSGVVGGEGKVEGGEGRVATGDRGTRRQSVQLRNRRSTWWKGSVERGVDALAEWTCRDCQRATEPQRCCHSEVSEKDGHCWMESPLKGIEWTNRWEESSVGRGEGEVDST